MKTERYQGICSMSRKKKKSDKAKVKNNCNRPYIFRREWEENIKRRKIFDLGNNYFALTLLTWKI